MNIGVIYPHKELAVDPGTVRAYAREVERLGFTHILAFDHIVGADPDVHTGWSAPYDVDTPFREPMVLYGFLAAVTSLELVTSVIIAPQRQTVLLAKQAAEVDILTGGRFRLGIGVGWNPVEYEALSQDFTTRGAREEEQITLMRRLWTERSVSFEGRFDRVMGAGVAPRPVQRPIPIWLGGGAPATYRRIGRLADGWFPFVPPGPELDDATAIIGDALADAGRDPAALGMEGRATWGPDGADGIIEQAEQWHAAGATHLSLNTMNAGLEGLDGHIEALTRIAAAIPLTAGSSGHPQPGRHG